MNPIDIRSYRGDFEDAAELLRRIWSAAYQGKNLFPVWDASFLRWQLGEESGALLPAAYDGSRVIATMFTTSHSLGIGSASLAIGIGSWFTIESEYRRSGLALRLIEAQPAKGNSGASRMNLVLSSNRTMLVLDTAVAAFVRWFAARISWANLW